MTTFFVRVRMSPRDQAVVALPRLVQAVYYVARARRAGVPEKHIERIRRRFGAFTYARRLEVAALIRDLAAPQH